MKKRIVVDTTGFISYFSAYFDQDSRVSRAALTAIDGAYRADFETLLIIPSVVFVEIFDIWYRNGSPQEEELAAKIHSEVVRPSLELPNIEVREIDYEIMQKFLEIRDERIPLELHDRIIYSTAIVLQAELVTSDEKIIELNNKLGNLITILS